LEKKPVLTGDLCGQKITCDAFVEILSELLLSTQVESIREVYSQYQQIHFGMLMQSDYD
jgi:hypothetical protein